MSALDEGRSSLPRRSLRASWASPINTSRASRAGTLCRPLNCSWALRRRLGVSTDYLLTGQETAPLGIAGAIRGDKQLSPTAKRHLIGILAELQGTG
jgi:hypothetical protein